MNFEKVILNGYENTKLLNYKEFTEGVRNTIAFDSLNKTDVSGVLKACYYDDNGKLLQTYTEQENHVGVIAATRLGKTTSYVLPTILSFARKKVKRSMIIADPKGELYRNTASELEKQGYRVILLNFRDYKHSDFWNPLTPIYRAYQKAFELYNQVEVVETADGLRNKYEGKIYQDQMELDRDLDLCKRMIIEEVGCMIDDLCALLITTEKVSDPYWENSARDVLKAFLWAMLEDSRPENETGNTLITEDLFSFNTILSIQGKFSDSTSSYDDKGYFTKRNENSIAYLTIKDVVFENASTTRRCVMSSFNEKMSVFRNNAMRMITTCNSFDMKELCDGPVALFINYRDELKVHYAVISNFVKDAYRMLIAEANEKPNGKLDAPFYFILDEFGNFPQMTDFDVTISACAGRNIFFVLIVQSYAQLDNVYGEKISKIIRDNLNVHVFFGSNNPETLEEFSKECGLYTRISPLSALNGNSDFIENYQIETIPRVPKSQLSCLKPGECIITEANCGYVMLSRLERYYLCKEFYETEKTHENTYYCPIHPLDKKYTYEFTNVKRNKRSLFD